MHFFKMNLESQLSGKLPSQPHPNPKEQVNRVILRESEEVNELEELKVISKESSNTIKLLDLSKEWLSSLPVPCKDLGLFSITCRIGKHCYHECMLYLGSSVNIFPYDKYMMYELDSLQSTNHTLAMADNTEHVSTIILGRAFLKTSKVLIDVGNGSAVLESNGEKIKLNMIDKVLIPEANATDYVANYLEQIG
ncbi:hypothetical protein RDABS01_036265, partial [Bienertia sinuspersici]